MAGFSLSPGITPFITDFVILIVVLSIGLSVIGSGGKWTSITLGLDSLALSLFKIYTDYFDPWDTLLAFLIAMESVVLIATLNSKNRTDFHRAIYLSLSLPVVFLSLYKVVSDFYDPFDLLLSCLGIVCGFAIISSQLAKLH